MRITQTEMLTTTYNVLYAQEPYNNISCLPYAVDTSKWSEFTYYPWMYPNEYVTGESMSGRVIAKRQGDGNNLQIKSALVDCRNITMVDLTIHNPFPYAIVVDCITYDEYNSIRDNDRHTLTAYGDYTRHYEITDDYYCFAVSLPDDAQYPNALVGLSQFVIYTGTVVTDGFTGCKINEQIDYTNFVSNSAYITGIGDFPIAKNKPFKIYDDDNNLYGTFYLENLVFEADETYNVTAYDVSYTLADKVSRGDWFEGHTTQDAVMNVFTYSNLFEWRTTNGETNMRSFIDVGDTQRITGLITWDTSLRKVVSAIALAVNSYPYTDRNGIVRFRRFDEDLTTKQILSSEEIVGRKISEPKHGIDRVVISEKKINSFSDGENMKTFKMQNYHNEWNNRFNEGDTQRRFTNADSDAYYKYTYYRNGNWLNGRTLYTSATNVFNSTIENTSCPSKRPSDTQRMYFNQTDLTPTGTYDLEIRGEYTTGDYSDDFTPWNAFPRWHGEEDDFYNDYNQLQISRSLLNDETSNLMIAESLYNILADSYTIHTSVLPNYDLNCGDLVMLEQGSHKGIIKELTIDLYNGGIIDLTIDCFLSN